MPPDIATYRPEVGNSLRLALEQNLEFCEWLVTIYVSVHRAPHLLCCLALEVQGVRLRVPSASYLRQVLSSHVPGGSYLRSPQGKRKGRYQKIFLGAREPPGKYFLLQTVPPDTLPNILKTFRHLQAFYLLA